MAVTKIAPEERTRWLQLYGLADKVNRLDPWQWMGTSDCFGVSVPGWSEPWFVVFGGESKAFRHVRFLPGWKSFYDLISRLSDPSKQVATWLLEIRMIELLYVNAELLFKHEQQLLRSLRRKAGASFDTPVFRSIVPGYHPWTLDAKERDGVETALYQAYGMVMRVESNSALLKARFPQSILLRSQQASGVWGDSWLPVKNVDDEEVEVRIDSARLQSVKDKPLKRITLQVDLAFIPLRLIPDGSRPQTAYVLLAVDARSGFIVAGDLMQATEGIGQMWSLIPDHLLQMFEKLGGCPATIEVCSDRMANLLRPLGELLPFKMVRREKLAMLESARQHLSNYITKPNGLSK